MHKTRHLSKRTHGKQCEFFQLYFHVQINNQMQRGVGGEKGKQILNAPLFY